MPSEWYARHDQITREFWASFLGSKVEKDGQVKGFKEWWNSATDWAKTQAQRYAHWCAVKVQRDNRDPDECVAAGVIALRNQLRLYRPPEPKPENPAYGMFRVALVKRILDEHLKPAQVAEILEAAADRFPEIEYGECVRYREMGDVWQPVNGPPLSPERVAQIRGQS